MFNHIIIKKDNLIENVKQVKQNNSNSLVCAMVKANAYGVGTEQVVQILNDYVDYFGVSCFFEAQKVKKFTNKKILIVDPPDFSCINPDFSYACTSIEDFEKFKALNKKINIHIKVNSGMNRFGINKLSNLKKIIKQSKNSLLNIEGIFTHFATSDNFVDTQFEKFLPFVELTKKSYPNVIVHADNSIVNQKKNHHLNMVRVGFSLFNQNCNNFLPVVEIKSTITQTHKIKKGDLVGYNKTFVANKNTKIAVLPLGYADGFSTRLIGFSLYVNGKACKVVNVCMDCLMLDISKTALKKGDEICLLNNSNSLSRYAIWQNISDYEVMTNFSFARADRLIVFSGSKDKQNNS